MQLPPETTAPGRLLDNGGKLMGRLVANKKAKALLPKFEPQQKALKAANLACNDAKDAVNMAEGPVREVDEDARALLTDLQLDLFKFVQKDYKDPLYVAVIPHDLTALKRKEGEDLRQELGRIAGVLGGLGKSHALYGYADKCLALVKAYDAPLKGLAAAQKVEADAWTARRVARQEWVLAWDGVYGEMRSLFRGRKAFVETFFPRFSQGRGKKVVKGEVAPG